MWRRAYKANEAYLRLHFGRRPLTSEELGISLRYARDLADAGMMESVNGGDLWRLTRQGQHAALLASTQVTWAGTHPYDVHPEELDEPHPHRRRFRDSRPQPQEDPSRSRAA
jgi:hypothetical protein